MKETAIKVGMVVAVELSAAKKTLWQKDEAASP